jgi:hypothetical protein
VELEGKIDSVGLAARRTIDSLAAWIDSQMVAPAESIPAPPPAVEESVEARAGRVWLEALKALPADLNAYERLVAEQELKDALARRFDLSREQLKKITAGS